MKNILISIVLSLIASFIYDTIKTFLRHKPTHEDSHEYTMKYLRDIKLEFYISLPIGIITLLTLPDITDSMYIFHLASGLFMFLLSLMAFMCLIEVVNNLANKNTGDDLN